MGKIDTEVGSGAGIRVGIADTGMGPHPYLEHVLGLGAIADGKDSRLPAATADKRGHGTHVAGLIGARPVDGSGDYAGVAQGAEIAAIRVFGADGGAHQGDVAEASRHLLRPEGELFAHPPRGERGGHQDPEHEGQDLRDQEPGADARLTQAREVQPADQGARLADRRDG